MHQQKFGLKIYWAWLCTPEQDPGLPTASPSHPSSIRVQTKEARTTISQPPEWNHNHRKLTKMITWITAMCKTMKLWAILCRATQDRHVMKSSNKTWSTGEGNDKPLQHSCLENPMSTLKRQKDMTPENEPPQVDRCLICYWGRAEKKLQKEWRGWVTVERRPSCGIPWWWKWSPVL